MALTRALVAGPTVQARSRSAAETLSAYAGLTRPRVLALVLFTGVPFLVGDDGAWPEAPRLVGILLGIALVGVACDALNAWVERDTDALMERTCQRPLPSGRLAANEALAFGLGSAAVAMLLLLAAAGPLGAILGLATIIHYSVVYTWWLKRRTPLNIVIGGAAGAAAPLIADAAAHGRVSGLAFLMSAVVFPWTPPHFWAIALRRRREYEAAGIPTLPGVRGERVTRRDQLLYGLVLVPVTLLAPATGQVGWAHGIVALLLGLWFLAYLVSALLARDAAADRAVYRASVAYVALLFSALLAARA